MKNILKVAIMIVFGIFTVFNVNAQNNKVNIKAEKVAEGVKIVSTQNGETSEFILSMQEAEEYIKQFGGSIDFDIDNEGSNYKISYATNNGETETLEVDLSSLLENLSIDFSEMSEDLIEAAKTIASEIEYEETVDENGNKIIKIKSTNKEE